MKHSVFVSERILILKREYEKDTGSGLSVSWFLNQFYFSM